MPGYGPQGYAANTSGTGSTAVVPPGVAGWNWGAFLLNWIWSIGNSVWIGLLALVPYAGLIMAIVLGIKGSEWAWQHRRWESVEQFKATQRVWAIVGLIVFLLSLIPIFAAILFPIFARAREAAQMHQGMPMPPMPR
jgi:uncharacterized membrane protein YeaQ/YmgE (transglycosylase-associated protein family)